VLRAPVRGIVLKGMADAVARGGMHPGLGLVPGRDVVLSMRCSPATQGFVDGAGDGVEAVGRKGHVPSFEGLGGLGKGLAPA